MREKGRAADRLRRLGGAAPGRVAGRGRAAGGAGRAGAGVEELGRRARESRRERASRGAAPARHGEPRRRERPQPLGRGCAGGADAGEGGRGLAAREPDGWRRAWRSSAGTTARRASWPPPAAGRSRSTGQRAELPPGRCPRRGRGGRARARDTRTRAARRRSRGLPRRGWAATPAAPEPSPPSSPPRTASATPRPAPPPGPGPPGSRPRELEGDRRPWLGRTEELLCLLRRGEERSGWRETVLPGGAARRGGAMGEMVYGGWMEVGGRPREGRQGLPGAAMAGGGCGVGGSRRRLQWEVGEKTLNLIL
jgi:hypothetical protein